MTRDEKILFDIDWKKWIEQSEKDGEEITLTEKLGFEGGWEKAMKRFNAELKEAREKISIDNLVRIFKKVLIGNEKYMVEFDNENDQNDFILDLVNQFREIINNQEE